MVKQMLDFYVNRGPPRNQKSDGPQNGVKTISADIGESKITFLEEIAVMNSVSATHFRVK